MAGDSAEMTPAEGRALARRRGGIAAFRQCNEEVEVFILAIRHLGNATEKEVELDIGGTVIRIGAADFDDLVNVYSHVRVILRAHGPREGPAPLEALHRFADQIGGAVASRRWVGVDSFEPVVVRITRRPTAGLLDIEFGSVLVMVHDDDFEQLLAETQGRT
jgi:hypothetical protein